MDKKDIFLFLLAMFNVMLFKICNVEFHMGSFLNGAVFITIWKIILDND